MINPKTLCNPPQLTLVSAIFDHDKQITVELSLKIIGRVESPLKHREDAPKQGEEGSPLATLVFDESFGEGLRNIAVGDRLLVLTWLDRADRSVLSVHPRDDLSLPLRGVFSTRSQDRPNPIGLHRVLVISVLDPLRFEVQNLEALDGTPILDVKPVLKGVAE
jgi:tRNA-Thr(GGU) m(6)t(6)A37 methyltransferase TsaA